MGYWLCFRLSRCSGLLSRIAQWLKRPQQRRARSNGCFRRLLCFGLRSLTQILVQPRKSKEKRTRKEAIAFSKLFQSALILTQQRAEITRNLESIGWNWEICLLIQWRRFLGKTKPSILNRSGSNLRPSVVVTKKTFANWPKTGRAGR